MNLWSRRITSSSVSDRMSVGFTEIDVIIFTNLINRAIRDLFLNIYSRFLAACQRLPSQLSSLLNVLFKDLWVVPPVTKVGNGEQPDRYFQPCSSFKEQAFPQFFFFHSGGWASSKISLPIVNTLFNALGREFSLHESTMWLTFWQKSSMNESSFH